MALYLGLCKSTAAGLLGLNAKHERFDIDYARDQLGTRFDTAERGSREYYHSCIQERCDLALEIPAADLFRDQFISEGHCTVGIVAR